ncbi:LmeA family phospholipid-binding protein [Streptomyces sp. NBC_01304]|uniref:LmeA family phospholipid-binding protein n=1 Tax=Streptomyces sp. NBC_01304 TaxID=2903818 RepID=UPI002E136D63|nr:DUF2993 domain-containing protein [Streptomyces sp. NBC_01304]
MRALRIVAIIAVILGAIFVAADRIAVGYAEDEVAKKVQASEGLAEKPDVSIKGFPFLTQIAGGELDEVEIGIGGYEASNGGDKVLIDELNAQATGVTLSDNFSSATAARATGSARIAYAELLKAAKVEPAKLGLGATAKVVGLSDGGNGKIKVRVEISGGGAKKQIDVLSSAHVEGGDTIKVDADSIPKKLDLGVLAIPLPERVIREITDFEQKVQGLPTGIKLDKVEAVEEGVAISGTALNVNLAG